MRRPLSIAIACSALAAGAHADDNLFVGTADGSVYLGDPLTGGFELENFPAIPVRAVTQLGNQLMVAVETGSVYAYDLGSGLVDDIFTVNVDPTDMVAHDGTLLISDADGTILRVNPVDGTVLESFATNFEVQALGIDGDLLYAGTPFGVFHEKDLSVDAPFDFAGLCGGPINSIVSTGSTLYLGDTTGNVYVFDKQTELVTYAYTVTNDATSVVADGPHLLFGGSDGSVVRVAPPFGQVIEEFMLPAGVDDLALVQPQSTLLADVHEVSVGAGASVELQLRVHTGVPGTTYWVLGSLSGKGPFPIGNTLLPLTPDVYTTISMQPTGPLVGNLGSLDAAGDGSATLILPAGSNPALAGATVYHASVIADLASPDIVVDATNAVALQLVP